MSGIIRGSALGAMFGTAGTLSGVMSAKNKTTYFLAIKWRDGGESLLEVSNEFFKIIIVKCFQ